MTPGTRSSPPKTIMEPKLNPSLEDDFPIERVAFLGSMLVFWGVVYTYIPYIYAQFTHNLYTMYMQQLELDKCFKWIGMQKR